jgi:hypothetical protein
VGPVLRTAFALKLCCGVCEPQLSYVDANAAVLWHFVVMMQAYILLYVAPQIFLEIFPVWKNFCPVFPQGIYSACSFMSKIEPVA